MSRRIRNPRPEPPNPAAVGPEKRSSTTAGAALRGGSPFPYERGRDEGDRPKGDGTGLLACHSARAHVRRRGCPQSRAPGARGACAARLYRTRRFLRMSLAGERRLLVVGHALQTEVPSSCTRAPPFFLLATLANR